MCCGQKRAGMRRAVNSSTQGSPAAPVANGKPMITTALRYTENSSVKVKGPATGREYEFSPSRPMRNVDPRDARLLVRSRFFRQG